MQIILYKIEGPGRRYIEYTPSKEGSGREYMKVVVYTKFSFLGRDL